MSTITIQSINYSGEVANILFKPAGVDVVVNLGNQVLPYIFNPSGLTPSYDVYGTYTIFVLDADCPNILNVPTPTPTPTPTVTPTSTVTPTPTITPTPTPTYNPCDFTPTPTPTKTPTPTPTPVLRAYLFIEPVSGSTNIGQWMYDSGSNFYGFTNDSQPTQNQTIFNLDMNKYVNFSGWTSGLFPDIIQQTVPQTSGGVDFYDNPIVAYNFLTTQIPQNYVGGQGWYTWIIPTSLTNNQRQTVIDLNINNNPDLFTAVGTEGVINNYTFTYSGTTIPATTYRVYTTYPNIIFKISDSNNIYMKGNTTAP